VTVVLYFSLEDIMKFRIQIVALILGLGFVVSGCASSGYYRDGYYENGYYKDGYYQDSYLRDGGNWNGHWGGHWGGEYKDGYYYRNGVAYRHGYSLDRIHRGDVRPAGNPDAEKK